MKQAAKGKANSFLNPNLNQIRDPFPSSCESDDNDDNISVNDDSDLDATDASDSHNEDEEVLEQADSTPFTCQSLNVADFVLVNALQKNELHLWLSLPVLKKRT